ncbi:MAG: hypothetical protein JXK94_00165 [Deltaproteobacteria bacterium]|nr:hypothetical protein [Deltaproteobacteria bacterium]
MKNWKWHFLALGWVVALAGAIIYINRPASYPDPPPGWTLWRSAGAVRAIAFYREEVWCGGLAGLYRLGGNGSAVPVAIPAVGGRIRVNALEVDGMGGLWVGHSEGLSCWDGRSWQTFTERDGLPDRYVAALLFCDDSLWVATYGGAVAISFPWREDFKPVSPPGGQQALPHPRLSAITKDRQGGLWFGSYAAPAGGVGRLLDGHWRHWLAQDGLPHPNITSFLISREGKLWVGCGYFQEGGVAVFAPQGNGAWVLERTLPVAELAGPKVRSLYQDQSGRMWLGHEYDGITVFSQEKPLRFITMADGLPASEVMTMRQAPDGALWLGTLGGAARLSPQALEALFTTTGCDDKKGTS